MVFIFTGYVSGMAAVWNGMSASAVFYSLLFCAMILILIRKNKKYLLLVWGIAFGICLFFIQKMTAENEIMRVETTVSKNFQAEVVDVMEREQGITCILKKEGIEGKILLYYSGDEIVCPGDRIKVWGLIELQEEASNPGQFSSKKYYFSKGIYYKSFSDHIQILKYNSKSLSIRVMQTRQFIRKQIHKQYRPEAASLVQGMLLGDKSEISEEQKDHFKESGLIHLLAVSGLHISIAGRSVYQMFRKAGMNFMFSALAGTFTAGFYCMLTGLSVSSIRAFLMLGVYFLSQILGKSYDILSSASFAGVVILARRPFYIWDSGFLLSFTAVFVIGLIQQIEPEWKGFSGQIKKRLWFPFAIQMGMFPVIIYLQYEAPVLSFLANVAAIPIASTAFSIAFLFVWVSPLPIHQIVQWMFQIVLWISKQKYGLLTVGNVPFFWLCICYLIFVLCMKKDLKIAFHIRILGIYLGILLIIIIPFMKSKDIAFIDVGQGDCMIAETAGGMIMVDGGSSSVKKIGRYRALPYLKYCGFQKVKIAVITHMDADHYSGILELLEMGRIEYLGLPQISKDNTYEKIERIALEKGTTLFYLSRGKKIYGEDFSLKVLHPEKNTQLEKNAASIVLQGEILGWKVLLTGDVEKEGESVLLEEGLKRTDILKAAHHGSKNSTSEEFLKLVRPELTIISCGKNNRYGHPHQEVLERLQKYGNKIKRTDQQGAIVLGEK